MIMITGKKTFGFWNPSSLLSSPLLFSLSSFLFSSFPSLSSLLSLCRLPFLFLFFFLFASCFSQLCKFRFHFDFLIHHVRKMINILFWCPLKSDGRQRRCWQCRCYFCRKLQFPSDDARFHCRPFYR